MSKYMKTGKAYYEAHKEQLLADEKDKKRWLSYYDRNKEAVKERNRARYYTKRGLPVPPPKVKKEPLETPEKPPVPVIPEKTLEMKRLEELVVELRDLLPEVVKKKARPRHDRVVAPAAPLESPASLE